MKTVNALQIRGHLGEILDELQRMKEPILVSKGKEIRAVLITPEQFKDRFIDFQARERKQQLLDTITGMRAKRRGEKNSIEIIREIRGYEK